MFKSEPAQLHSVFFATLILTGSAMSVACNSDTPSPESPAHKASTSEAPVKPSVKDTTSGLAISVIAKTDISFTKPNLIEIDKLKAIQTSGTWPPETNTWKDIEGGTPSFAPPTIPAVLRVSNPTSNTVHFLMDGDPVDRNITLEGPSPFLFEYTVGCTEIFWIGKTISLAPGEHHDISLDSLLSYGNRCDRGAAYWLEPGSYNLAVQFQTMISVGARSGDETPKTLVKLISPPIQFNVHE